MLVARAAALRADAEKQADFMPFRAEERGVQAEQSGHTESGE